MKKLYTALKIRMPLRSIKSAFLVASFSSISFCSFSNEKAYNYGNQECMVFSEPPRPLSFELLSFKAVINENSKVELNWSAGAEKSVSHYIMQRSADGHEFKDAALIFVSECNQNIKTEHRYIDDINVIKGKLVYYRLKIVDTSGKSIYSDAVIVRKSAPFLITSVKILGNEIASK